METQLKNLTPEQVKIIDLFRKEEFLVNNFYFTGGTALCSAYLNHRYSDDLDFFSENKFDSLGVLSLISKWADLLGAAVTSRNIGDLYVFNLDFKNNYTLRVDFAYYPYKCLFKPTVVSTLKVDSLKDIAVNKLVTISQRSDVKDFVDLYFLLKDLSLFDLISWSNTKFKRDYDPILLASDFLKIEQFDYLPRMIIPLELNVLKGYFVDLARKLGDSSTD